MSTKQGQVSLNNLQNNADDDKNRPNKKNPKTNTHDIQYVSNYMYVLYHSHKYLIIIWTEHSCQSTEESMFELLNFLFQNISYIFKYFSFSLILQKYSF